MFQTSKANAACMALNVVALNVFIYQVSICRTVDLLVLIIMIMVCICYGNGYLLVFMLTYFFFFYFCCIAQVRLHFSTMVVERPIFAYRSDINLAFISNPFFAH